MSVLIRDNATKTVRTVEKQPDKNVRVMYDVREPIPLKDQPEVLGQIIGRQLAGLKALSDAGARFDNIELDQLSLMAKTVVQLATAMKKLEEPSREPTEDELRKIANGS